MERSAGIVLKDDGKYLLLQYEAGHWDFPKGHLEKGETDEEAALRELKEETDLTADIISGFKEKLKYFFKHNGKLIAKEVVFFIAKAKKGKVAISHEHVGFLWLPFDEAIAKLTYENARDILRKAEEWLKTND